MTHHDPLDPNFSEIQLKRRAFSILRGLNLHILIIKTLCI